MATLTIDKAQRSLLDPIEEPAPRERRTVATPTAPAAPAQRVDPRAPDAGGASRSGRAADGATLDDLVARTWSSLLVSRAAPCLLCGGEVAPRYGTGPHPVGGACRSCGTEMA